MGELNPLIHAPKRLRLMSLLAAFEEVAFSRIQEELGLSAPDVSKQIKTLVEAGYVRTKRSGRGPGSRTWVSLTRRGATAYRAHVEALHDLLGSNTDTAGPARSAR